MIADHCDGGSRQTKEYSFDKPDSFDKHTIDLPNLTKLEQTCVRLEQYNSQELGCTLLFKAQRFDVNS